MYVYYIYLYVSRFWYIFMYINTQNWEVKLKLHQKNIQHGFNTWIIIVYTLRNYISQ